MKLYVSKNCPNCPKAKENMDLVAKELGFEYEKVDISTDEGQIDALDNMVMSTPTLLLDAETQAGKDILHNLDELKKIIREKGK